MIARIAASHEARPHLAEELVQEILFAVWRALPAFRAESSLRSFVARIASNRAASHVVQAMRTPAMGELDEGLPAAGESPEGTAVAADSQARLLQAVRGLPLISRQVVTLTLEGFGPGEIASALGIGANAVSVRLKRAKEQLRQHLGEPE
jgi:RNA polymerase sigma factor (sigma-70 family)